MQGTTARRFRRVGSRWAIRRPAQVGTTCTEFLRDVAAAGVVRYVAEMATRTCTCLGAAPGEAHVEVVP